MLMNKNETDTFKRNLLDERFYTKEQHQHGITTLAPKTFKHTGIDGYYISHDGYIMSIKKKGYPIILSEFDNGHGYKKVKLMNDRKQSSNYVHRLVADKWIPNPLNKEQVNHLDNDTTNNHVSNLEWCTHKENQKHRHWMNLMRKACGSNYMKDKELKSA